MLVGSTPTFTLTFPAATDLSEVEHFVFSVVQSCYELHKQDDGIEVDENDANIVHVTLDQSDTINFVGNEKAKIQLNWGYSDGTRGGSKVKEITVEENLYKEIMMV